MHTYTLPPTTTHTHTYTQRIVSSSYMGKDREDEADAKARTPVERDRSGYKVNYPHDYDTYY